MNKTAAVMGLFGAIINMITIAYVQTELSDLLSETWRLAIIVSLVTLSVHQMVIARDRCQKRS